MARIRLFIYIILFTILPAAAGVFDATSAARLLFNAESRAASDPDVYAGVLVRLDDEERGLATLAEAQARIFGRRGDIVICCVPIANLDSSTRGTVCSQLHSPRRPRHFSTWRSRRPALTLFIAGPGL